MQVLASVPKNCRTAVTARPVSVTIGNFDGNHLGHQHLVAQALKAAHAAKIPSLALTFEPRPDRFFNKKNYKKQLFTSQQKERSFRELGLDFLLIQNFDQDFSEQSPQQFIDHYLLGALQTYALSVGEDFCFGKNREGDVHWLAAHSGPLGNHLHICPRVLAAAAPISSTRLRAEIEQGHLGHARTMLGRPYLLEGLLARGDQLGRTIGFPTVNLTETAQLLPGPGVYAGYVWLGHKQAPPPAIHELPDAAIPAVIHCGIRPTIADSTDEPRIEAHLLSGEYPQAGLYGVPAGFYFTEFLRVACKFESLQALRQQISQDIEQAKQHLAPPL